MNNFQITISAVDRATATVKKINAQFTPLQRSVQDLGRATKAVGRELGLDSMAKSIGGVARNAKKAASEIMKLGAPLLAIIGGGSLIGVALLANEWARLGAEVSRTSKTLGVSTGDLQSLRGAAQVAGLSSEELTGGLKSLGDTMQDALYGRNQEALGMLNKLGITIRKTSSGAIDSTRAFNDMAVAISNIKSPQVQGLVARSFGLESLLPLLRQGPAAIAAYQRQVRELGAEMSPAQVARAERFGMALNYLSVAGQGLRNTIGDALIPAFQPLIENMSKFLAENREAIGIQVGVWARDFAGWLKDVDFKQFYQDAKVGAKGVGEFVDSIGGWKTVAIGVAAVMAGPLLLSITNIGLALTGLAIKAVPVAITGLSLLGTALGGAEATASMLAKTLAGVGTAGAVAFAGMAGWEVGKGINWLLERNGISLGSKFYDLMNPEQSRSHLDQTGSARSTVDFFKKQGWSDAQAIGIAANLQKESNFSTSAIGDGGKAYGVAQWHDDRQRNFMRWSGKNIRQATMEEQLGFVNYELTQGTERRAGDALKGATNERQAASIVSRMYERPGNADGEAAGRANAASEMKMSLEIKGLPAGVTATARRTDGANVPVRVANSMPAGSLP